MTHPQAGRTALCHVSEREGEIKWVGIAVVVMCWPGRKGFKCEPEIANITGGIEEICATLPNCSLRMGTITEAVTSMKAATAKQKETSI